MKIIAVFAVLLAHSAIADPLQLDFSAAVLSGGIDGFMQTPAGGLPNRSDVTRPTFQELGVEKLTSYSVEFGFLLGRNRFFIGANVLRDVQNTQLQSDLLSQWQQFRAGDETSVQVQLDWHRVGYLRHFQSPKYDQLSYALGVDATLFSFHYELSNGVEMVDRAYNKGGYRIGATGRYEFASDLSLNIATFLPIHGASTADITSVDVAIEYRFNDTLSGTLGLALLEIDYRDAQTFPNHVVVQMEPQFRIGFVLATD